MSLCSYLTLDVRRCTFTSAAGHAARLHRHAVIKQYGQCSTIARNGQANIRPDEPDLECCHVRKLQLATACVTNQCRGAPDFTTTIAGLAPATAALFPIRAPPRRRKLKLRSGRAAFPSHNPRHRDQPHVTIARRSPSADTRGRHAIRRAVPRRCRPSHKFPRSPPRGKPDLSKPRRWRSSGSRS